MRLRDVVRVAAVLALCLTTARGASASDAGAGTPGGSTTLPPGRRPGLDEPFANLSLDERFAIAPGTRVFRDPWIAAPATTTARDGLGPLYNAHACVSCHPAAGAVCSTRTVRRPSRSSCAWPGNAPDSGAVEPDPVYGDQLQTRGLALATPGAVAEGAIDVTWATERGAFADGTPYELRRPEWRIVAAAYGALDPGPDPRRAWHPPSVEGCSTRSPRQRSSPARTRTIATATASRAARAVCRTRTASPPSDASAGRRRSPAAPPGRVRAAQRPRHHQRAATRAAVHRGAVRLPRVTPSGADPPNGAEIADPLLALLTRFTATLAVAAPNADTDEVRSGQRFFARAGCDACHVPVSTTGDDGEPAATRQEIRPYTDLLLHDMGPWLADAVGEADAAVPSGGRRRSGDSVASRRRAADETCCTTDARATSRSRSLARRRGALVARRVRAHVAIRTSRAAALPRKSLTTIGRTHVNHHRTTSTQRAIADLESACARGRDGRDRRRGTGRPVLRRKCRRRRAGQPAHHAARGA